MAAADLCYHIDVYKEQSEGSHRRFWSKKVLISIGMVLSGIIILGGFLWLLSAERTATAPLRTSDKFLSNMFRKRVDEAYALTSDMFRAETTEEEFSRVADTASRGLKYETLKPLPGKGVIEDTDRGKLATIVYEIDGNDGIYEMTVRALQEKGKGWRIVGVENVKKS